MIDIYAFICYIYAMKLRFITLSVVFGFFWGINVIAAVDTDGDGIIDAHEIEIYGTDPSSADTDGDGYSDSIEIASGYSPIDNRPLKLNQLDSDKDGLWDDWELALGTNLNNADTDGDGYGDGLEMANGYDPRETSVNKVEKRIKIDISTQTLSYYYADTELESFKISSGLPGTPTPKGTFKVLKKRPQVQYGGQNFDYYYPNTKWNLLFKYGSWGNYYIHGAYWHDNFGNKMSHGCVNVPYTEEKMGRLYDWADLGTNIEIL